MQHSSCGSPHVPLECCKCILVPVTSTKKFRFLQVLSPARQGKPAPRHPQCRPQRANPALKPSSSHSNIAGMRQPRCQRLASPRRVEKNRQPPCVHPAILPECPANAPVGAAPTIHACPTSGVAGGAATTPSTALANKKSIATKASFTVVSFCACTPRMAVLRPAQTFRLSCRIQKRLRTIGPHQPAYR